MNLTTRDPLQTTIYEHAEEHNAKRVYVVNPGVQSAPNGSGINTVYNTEYKEIQVPVIIKEIEIVRVEVPVVVKETEYKTVEVPVIVRETEYKTVEVPVYVSAGDTPTVVNTTVEKNSELAPKIIAACLIGQLVIQLIHLLKN